MAARITEMRTNRPAPAEPEPLAVASSRAREAFFASFSKELRWALDHEGRVLLVEGAWQSVVGWLPEQLHGWYWGELVHPADRARVGEILDRVIAGRGSERDVDLRLAVPGGGYRLTYWTFVAGSGTDSILGLGLSHDSANLWRSDEKPSVLLTQRNAELAARLTELEDRYTAVERFAATAAHQLAEPLVIAESSAILVAEELGEELDPMLRARLDAIGRSAGRARRLMDALLADARTNGRTLKLRPVEVGSVVEATLASLAYEIEARNASVVVGPLPRALGEAGLLSIVLENLVSNALKYGPRSGARVEISAKRRNEGWRISVSSEGTPIPPEEASRIFQPFYRAPGERRVPGVGLGLTICARLIQRLGGSIGVMPGVGGGNAFWIELRAA
jgi:signal transduction histidine kinase